MKLLTTLNQIKISISIHPIGTKFDPTR